MIQFKKRTIYFNCLPHKQNEALDKIFNKKLNSSKIQTKKSFCMNQPSICLIYNQENILLSFILIFIRLEIKSHQYLQY